MLRIALLVMLVALTIGTAAAQTPLSRLAVGGEKKGSGGASTVNPWLGSQLGYRFTGGDDLASNLLVSASLLSDIDIGIDAAGLPVMGNVSGMTAQVPENDGDKEAFATKINELVTSSQGINVGIYPYYLIQDKEYWYLAVHGSAGWKLNAFADSSAEKRYLNQGRFTGGLEIGLGSTTAEPARLTLSVTPMLTIFNPDEYEAVFSERKSRITGTEVTAVIPIGANMGLLMESVLFTPGRSTVRIGVLFNTQAD